MMKSKELLSNQSLSSGPNKNGLLSSSSTITPFLLKLSMFFFSLAFY